MRARALGVLLAAVVPLWAYAHLVVLPAPAYAAAPCVGVIVDGRLLGEDVRTGCATGDPDSGLQALTKAGFSYAFVPRQPGLVCQIDGLPDCGRTTATTYWSYWYREPGSSRWVYSSFGAGQHDPKPGSTEAWVWQDGGRREPPDVALAQICPQVTEKPSTTPKPSTTTASPKPATKPTTSPTPKPTTPTPKPTTEQPSSPTSTPTEAASTVSPTSSPTPSPAATGARPEPAAAANDGGGSPLPLIAALGAIGALFGASRWQRSRRRPPEEGP